MEPSQVVTLNVAGQLIQTRRETLRKMQMVDRLLDFPSDRTPEEPAFLDLDPDTFKLLLNVARGLLPPSTLLDLPDVQRQLVLASADYLQMNEVLQVAEAFNSPTRFRFRFAQSNDYALITNEGTVYTVGNFGRANTVLGDRQLPPAGRFYWEVNIVEKTSGTWDWVGLAESGVDTTTNMTQSHAWAWASTSDASGVVVAGSGTEGNKLPCFKTGTVVGVDVDVGRGTLSFWADGKFLGLAVDGLKGKTLFPACSVGDTTVMQLRTGLAPPDLVAGP